MYRCSMHSCTGSPINVQRHSCCVPMWSPCGCGCMQVRVPKCTQGISAVRITDQWLQPLIKKKFPTSLNGNSHIWIRIGSEFVRPVMTGWISIHLWLAIPLCSTGRHTCDISHYHTYSIVIWSYSNLLLSTLTVLYLNAALKNNFTFCSDVMHNDVLYSFSSNCLSG